MKIQEVYFQELYDSLEKLRPSLFRLASDTDEKDNDAISTSLFLFESESKLISFKRHY